MFYWDPVISGTDVDGDHSQLADMAKAESSGGKADVEPLPAGLSLPWHQYSQRK